MAQPVSVPSVPVPVNDAIVTRAETLLTTILQMMANGSAGATNPADNAQPLLKKTGVDPITGAALTEPVKIEDAPNQLWYRQVAMAILIGTTAPPVWARDIYVAGVNASPFTLSYTPYDPLALFAIKDGQVLEETQDYTLVGNVLTLVGTFVAPARLVVRYLR
jgi:hypothetical protein